MGTFTEVAARLGTGQPETVFELESGFDYTIGVAATGGTWNYTDGKGVVTDNFDVPYTFPNYRGQLGVLANDTQQPKITCVTGNITILRNS